MEPLIRDKRSLISYLLSLIRISYPGYGTRGAMELLAACLVSNLWINLELQQSFLLNFPSPWSPAHHGNSRYGSFSRSHGSISLNLPSPWLPAHRPWRARGSWPAGRLANKKNLRRLSLWRARRSPSEISNFEGASARRSDAVVGASWRIPPSFSNTHFKILRCGAMEM